MRLEFLSLHAVVDALYIYPIKACAGERVPALQFSAQGLIAGDRQWVVVNTDAQVVWQGSHPQLALVQPHLSPGCLHISSPHEQALAIPMPPQGGACQVKIWNGSLEQNETFNGIDAGDAAAAWLHRVTRATLRLVQLDAAAWTRGAVNHCHITSTASLGAINAAQAQQGLPAAGMARFRPNIVIADGPSSPLDPFMEVYATDLCWMDAGRAANLVVQEPCIRCIVPNVDPRTATLQEGALVELG